MTQTFSTFLKEHTCPKDGAKYHTHTRIGCEELGIYGGSWLIPDCDYETFMKKYYEEIITNGKEGNYTEKQLDEGAILIDYDFRYKMGVNKRQHTHDHIIDIVMCYDDQIREVYNIPDDTTYEVYVLEKPNVNVLDDKTKDGIHIIICINMKRQDQIQLRTAILPKLKIFLDDLPLTNTWENVYDEGIVKANANWQMLGSQKPNGQPYSITNYFIIKNGEYVERSLKEEDMHTIFMKLSARNKSHPSFEYNANYVQAPIQAPKNKSPTLSKSNSVDSGIDCDNIPHTTDKWTDLLFNVIKNDVVNGVKTINRDNGKWYVICHTLISNKYNKNIWLDYCKTQSNPLKTTASDLWDNFLKTNKPNSIYALSRIAKEVNLSGYNEWIIKYKQYIPIKVLIKGENDIAEHIAPKLKIKLKLCNEEWWKNDKQTKLWHIVRDPIGTIITHIQEEIDESKETLIWKKNKTEDPAEKKKYTELEEKYTEFYKLICKPSMSNQILRILKDKLIENDFTSKLNVKPFMVVYKNGILDLRTLIFKEGIDATDYLTHTIPYDHEWAIAEDKEWVKKELQKICNMNKTHLDYYLSTFGYSMTGDSSKKQEFYCFRGQTADNGKSIIFEALGKIIPNYIGKLESKIFEINFANRHKSVACWGGKRIMWINELSKKPQDSEFMKEVSDGNPVEYQVMRGTTASMPICFKTYIVSNNTIKYADDNGMNRRIRILQFDSNFGVNNKEDNYETNHFIRDEEFCTLLQTKYKHALMEIIYEYSKMYIDTKALKPIPAEWIEETKTTIQDNNKFKTFFDDNFNIEETGQVSKEDVDHILTLYKDGQINFKDELKKMKIVFTYNSQERMSGCSKKGIYTGFCKLQTNDVPE